MLKYPSSCDSSDQLANNFEDVFENTISANRNDFLIHSRDVVSTRIKGGSPPMKYGELSFLTPITTKNLIALTEKMACKSFILDQFPLRTYWDVWPICYCQI